MSNTLWYGDNLRILREEIADESVDLIYLDPPFNSNRDYNVLFKEKSGESSPAQIQAFTDTWTWDQAAVDAYDELITDAPNNVSILIEAMRQFVGANNMMAYLVMMAQRLVELHRVLKPTGTIYLHCDPAASHYLKIIMDTVFGAKHFRNEIVWRRTGSHNSAKRFGPVHDVILFYTKTETYTWNRLRRPYMMGHVRENFIEQDGQYRTNYYGNVLTGSGTRNGESGKVWRGYDPTAKGRHWAIPGAVKSDLEEAGVDLSGLSQHDKLDLMVDHGFIEFKEDAAWPVYQRFIKGTDGLPIGDIWAYQPYTEGTLFGTTDAIDSDVRWLNPQSQERLGYPTQKPLGLLARIIESSSNPGDVVLDPFCGCGTAVVAAQKLDRKWIGIDITHLAVALMNNRLVDMFGETLKFEIRGIPTTVGSAQMLAEQDRYEFQYWANSLVNAQPLEVGSDGKGKKGADGGVDGVIRFIDDDTGKAKRVLVSVKSGGVQRSQVADLIQAMNREKADMCLFVTLQPSTKPMREEALSAGKYESPWWGRSYPRCQILTIEELLNGVEPEMPPMRATFLRAQRLRKASEHHAVGLPGLE